MEHIFPPEFVEVILLPLAEFQAKIDGRFYDCSLKHGTYLHTHDNISEHLRLFCLFVFPSGAELQKKEKIVVDAKVYLYAMGMVQAFFKPNELPVLKQ